LDKKPVASKYWRRLANRCYPAYDPSFIGDIPERGAVIMPTPTPTIDVVGLASTFVPVAKDFFLKLFQIYGPDGFQLGIGWFLIGIGIIGFGFGYLSGVDRRR
jgi:hypothetical protein